MSGLLQMRDNMSKFYIKTKSGEFIPVELNSIMNNDLHDRLIIVRVGSDDYPVSKNDLYETVKSFEDANVINKIRNVSVIVTPYQIDVGIESKDKIDDKTIYLQIKGGDMTFLEDEIKDMYKKIKSKHNNAVVLPSPLKIRDYQYIKDVLKRCQIRKDRRGKK